MPGPTPELSVVISIDNHKQIAAAYGHAAIECVREAIQRYLTLPGVCCTLTPDDLRHLHVEIVDVLAYCSGPKASDDLVELLLEAIASTPLSFDGATLHVAPSVVSVSSRCEPGDALVDQACVAPAELEQFAFDGRSSPRTEGWKDGYRRDMAIAAECFEAIAQDRLQLAWQPVRHASAGVEILYHECLLRVIDTGGALQLPGRFIPALERLGLMRFLDRHVVQRVVEELRAAPSVTLAANISGQSVADDCWWHSLREALAASPDLATRLVLEITESAELASMSSAVEFIATMRKLGCKIAIDDFGMGHASLHHLVALKPDMVKVDAFYTRWADQTPQAQLGLTHLIGLLATLAPIVIVEGVGSNDQSTMILNAGAAWQQGYHHGGPTMLRPSKYAGAVALSGQREAAR